MTPPSKELLSAVLNVHVVELTGVSFVINGNDTLVHYTKQPGIDIPQSINIYELAHKVKEWALKQGYRIASQLIERGITIDIGMDGFAVVHTCNREVNKEREDTEPEAVFAAGEWILNQQDKGI